MGKYNVASSCLKVTGGLNLEDASLAPQTCTSTTISGTLNVTGSITFTGTEVKDDTVTTGDFAVELDKGCLNLSGTQITCEQGAATAMGAAGYKMDVVCTPRADGGCSCKAAINQKGEPGFPSPTPATIGNFSMAGNQVSLTTDGAPAKYDYCVAGGNLTMTPKTGSATIITGTIALTPDTGSSGTGGAGSGGAGNTAGTSNGGSSSGTGGVTTGGGGGGGGSPPGDGKKKDGPCDIYAAASMPCAAAYSTTRALLKSYTGFLIQVRNGSSATNQGTGGMTKDIGQTPDGYLDTAALDAFCMGSYCTVSKLYDQSGNGNDIGRAPSGNTAGGATGAEDDYESTIGTAKSKLTAGGHPVHSLYMAKHDGYRTARGMKAKGVPMMSSPQTIYELADGGHFGDGCCWDFGNVTTDPKTYADMNTLFFGKAFWGNGAPPAPWFMADFEAGVWAGGSAKGDPGWGSLNDPHPVNSKDPSMMAAAFALGMLKTGSGNWGLFAADTAKDAAMTTAFEGKLPKPISNAGRIVLGVGGDNSNNSWGTFYEGAIVSGYATTATDTAVLQNIKAVGYAK